MSNSNCKKSSSLNKKACHRKKPKGSFNHTWSASTYKNQIQQQCSTLNLTSASSYIISTLPIETRIDFYEKKYEVVMETETRLSSWIKSSREKDPPPSPPISYKPIPTATKSRLPDFIFSSLSTRPKRKSQLYFDSQPTAKSSISTFLRKASDTLTTSYNKQPSKRPQKTLLDNSKASSTLQHQNNHRFSLTSSLNRLSLSRNSYNSMISSEDPSCSINNENRPIDATTTTTTTITTTKLKYKRFSTPLSPHQESPPPPVQQKKTLRSSTDSTVVKERPQSNLLPHSSSSIFLERLRSRSPILDNTPKSPEQTSQPNVLSQSNTYYNSNSSIGTMDDDTPPSSPSSIDSVLTPPLSPNSNSHHLYYQQRNKRRSQELFFNHAKPKPSLSMMANITENKLLEQQEEKTTLSQTNNNNNCIPATTAPSNGGNYSVIDTTTATNHQAKKKRASLIITPSLSTIRLLSQKSQFLKRQSMLA